MEPLHTPSTRRTQHPLLILAALAVILFCLVGTAAVMGWLPSSRGGTNSHLSEAERAALAANLQQPAQAVAPVPAPMPSTLPVPATSPATAPAYAAQPAPSDNYPAYPIAPNPPAPARAQSYAPAAVGYSGAQGSTGYGYAPADTPAPAPVRETGHPKATRATQLAEAEPREHWCGNCGNVESIRQITTRARGSGIGAAGGAILGGLLGNQLGGGHGRQLATVAGAVGGAVVGNQVEGNMNANHSYEIRVRLDDGTLRTFHQHSVPRWRSGDRVRVVKGALHTA